MVLKIPFRCLDKKRKRKFLHITIVDQKINLLLNKDGTLNTWAEHHVTVYWYSVWNTRLFTLVSTPGYGGRRGQYICVYLYMYILVTLGYYRYCSLVVNNTFGMLIRSWAREGLGPKGQTNCFSYVISNDRITCKTQCNNL